MGHNDGTQSHLEPMPKPQYLFNRNGRYLFRQRIPLDLVRAGCYGKMNDIKRSLKTSDHATAIRLYKTVTLQVDEEFRAKRRELEQTTKEATCCNTAPMRRLVDLSELERRDFITRMFITSEQRETETRLISDPDERNEILEIVGPDLTCLERQKINEDYDWQKEIKSALESQGISTDGADVQSLHDLARQMLQAKIETTYRTVQALEGYPYEFRDALFANIHAHSPLPMAAPPSKTIADLCKEYMARNLQKVENGRLARSTISKIEMRCRLLTDFFGKGKALAALTREDAARLVAFLPTVPHSAAKRYKGVSLVTAAEREAKSEGKRLIHPQTADDYLTGVSAMLSFAVQNGWLRENPLENKLIREGMPRLIKRDRQMLTPDEMTMVFASPDFIAQRSGGRGKLEARFWLPLLCLFHGTRANEVAGMRVADVEQTDGIAFLNLRETDEHRLKTATSTRRVPVHGKLIELGFLSFVARRREQEPDGPLFTGLARNNNGSMADGVCKWWQRLVTGILGAAPANAAIGARGIHSLRHSWVAAARAAGLDDSTRKRLGGWSQADASEGYGWSGALPMLKKAIDKIEYPGVDFPRPIRRIERR